MTCELTVQSKNIVLYIVIYVLIYYLSLRAWVKLLIQPLHCENVQALLWQALLNCVSILFSTSKWIKTAGRYRKYESLRSPVATLLWRHTVNNMLLSDCWSHCRPRQALLIRNKIFSATAAGFVWNVSIFVLWKITGNVSSFLRLKT